MFYTMKRTSLSGEPVIALYIIGFNMATGNQIQHLYINYYDEPCGECVIDEPIDLEWDKISGEEIEDEIGKRLNHFIGEMARNCFEDGFDRTCYLYDWGLIQPADAQSQGPFMILTALPNEDGTEIDLDNIEELFDDQKTAKQKIESLRSERPDGTEFIIVEYQEK